MVNDYMTNSTFCQQLKATLIRNLKLKWREPRKTVAVSIKIKYFMLIQKNYIFICYMFIRKCFYHCTH